MYVIENALLNVLKNKGRYALLGVIICAIIAEYKASFGSEVTIAPKMQQVSATGGNAPAQGERISPEQSVAFAQSQHLQSAALISSLGCHSVELRAIDQNDSRNPVSSSVRDRYGGDLAWATMRLLGDSYGDFDEGNRMLAEGSMPLADGECLVSVDIAELNALAVGDGLLLYADLFTADGSTSSVAIPLTLAGTYHDGTEEYAVSGVSIAYQNRRNEILTTFDTILCAQGEGLSGVAINAAYYLNSPDLLDEFEAELRSLGLPASYRVSTDEAGYRKMTEPAEGLRSIARIFLLVVLVLGGALVALLASIAIRERKYEIGVLRAMGMKKGKVTLGLWTELITVTCICFILGLGAGSVLAQPVGDALLKGQRSSSVTLSAAATTGGAQSLERIDASLNGVIVAEIFGLSLLLASIAGVASISRITKYEPIQILMERN